MLFDVHEGSKNFGVRLEADNKPFSTIFRHMGPKVKWLK